MDIAHQKFALTKALRELCSRIPSISIKPKGIHTSLLIGDVHPNF